MVDDSIRRIRALLKRPGMTKLLLTEAAKVHRNVLLGVDDDDWNPRTKTLRALEKAAIKLEKAAS